MAPLAPVMETMIFLDMISEFSHQSYEKARGVGIKKVIVSVISYFFSYFVLYNLKQYPKNHMSLSLLEEYIEAGNSLAIDNLLNENPSLCKQRTSHDISPLLLACYYNKPQIIKVLLRHMDELTIHEAAAANELEQVQAMIEDMPDLLDRVSDHGFTPLGIATHFGNEDMVRFLLTKGADTNAYSQNGYQVYPLHTAIGSGFENIAKMLIEAGAEVNVLQSSRTTPLHLASQIGNIELIILLLEHGALVEVKNDMGKTASDLAAEKGYQDIAEILKA